MYASVDASLVGKETSTIHRFERVGLGKAPFAFTGEVTEKTYQACHGAPVQPGSTCDFCGTCIRYEFWVRSSDGKTFKVGCDCIHKSGDAGLVKQISAAERKLRDKKNAAARVRKQELAKKQLDEALKLFPSMKAAFAEKPHPVPHHAANGKSLLDYLEWCLSNGYQNKIVPYVNAK